MNGSGKASGRDGAKHQASEQAQPSAKPKVAPAKVGYDPSTGECALCWKVRRPHVECQERWRIWAIFDDMKADFLKERSRRGAVVCKDCCISRLDGHKCQWWDLCWNI